MLESSAYELGESDNAIKQQLGELKQAADQLEGNQVKIKQELSSDFENLKDQTILQQNDIYDYGLQPRCTLPTTLDLVRQRHKQKF